MLRKSSSHKMGSFVSLNEEPPKPCCNGRLNRRPCYALICTGLCALFLLVTVVVVLALLPTIAQNAITGTTLSISSLSLLQPSNSSLKLAMVGSLSSAGPFDAVIDEFPLSISYRGAVIGTIPLPAMSVKSSTPTVLNVNPNLTITDMSAFGNFSEHLLRDAEITWTLTGHFNLAATFLGMTFHLTDLTFQKDVVIKGLDGFRQFNVTSADMSHSNSTAILVRLNAVIVNPSVIAMRPAGVLFFDCYYEGMKMGSVVSQEVNLDPGINNVSMLDWMYPVPSDDPRAEELFSKALSGQTFTLTVVGTGGTIPLYSPALAGLSLNTSLSLQLQPIITGVVVRQGEIDMDPSNFSQMILSLLTDVIIDNPLGPDCPLTVHNLSMDFTLFTEDGREVGSASTPSCNATTAGNASVITIPLFTTMNIGPAFSVFAQQWVSADFVTVHMRGTAKASVLTVAGPMTLSGIAVNTTVTLVGLSKFSLLNLTEVSLSISGGDERGIFAVVQFSTFCASNVGIDLGENSNLSLAMFSGDVQVGTSVVPHFRLMPGTNVGVYPAILYASDPDAMEKLVSEFMNGNDTVLGVSATQPASIYPALDPALSGLSTTTILRGQHDKLLLNATMHAGEVSFLKSIIPTTLAVHNSFDADIEVVECATAVYYTKDMTKIATLNEDLRANPIKVPGQSTVMTPALNFQYQIHWDTFIAMFKGLEGVDLTVGGGTITVRFGGVFEQKIAYQQSGIVTYLRL